MQQHLLLDTDRLQFRQQPLGLPECVAEQQGRTAAVPLPPVADLRGQLGSGLPAVNRHAEGRFGDQHVAGHRFERCAARVVVAFVIPAHHPDLPLRLQTDLSGSEHMPGTVEGHPALAEPDRFPIADGMQADLLSESLTQHAFADIHRPVLTASRPGMVGMGVGDQSPGHRSPGIHPGVCRPAVEPFRGALDQGVAS